ncbi:hypothetical protein [Paractinoplanes lichenicola]|uniref:Uncharacterized protein n=1 Tax=Paractinoplanes lichenicola TaxID=2802976 RepID=A0ABS1VE61_9ACTN|nr:hypothetical protein [Actinoplanes lichenicola]MBL7252963.1 hypothetical protein [Actinoplanes lichenicola]
MRARRTRFLAAIVSAVVIALFAPAAAGTAQAVTCPGSTSWDNILQRCV